MVILIFLVLIKFIRIMIKLLFLVLIEFFMIMIILIFIIPFLNTNVLFIVSNYFFNDNVANYFDFSLNTNVLFII